MECCEETGEETGDETFWRESDMTERGHEETEGDGEGGGEGCHREGLGLQVGGKEEGEGDGEDS